MRSAAEALALGWLLIVITSMLAVLFRANWVGWPVDRVVGESGPRRLRACAVVLHVSVMAPAPAGGLGRACCPGRCASLPDHRVLGRPGRLVVACSVAGGACAWCLGIEAGGWTERPLPS